MFLANNQQYPIHLSTPLPFIIRWLEFLGSGSEATVYSALTLFSPSPVAIKLYVNISAMISEMTEEDAEIFFEKNNLAASCMEFTPRMMDYQTFAHKMDLAPKILYAAEYTSATVNNYPTPLNVVVCELACPLSDKLSRVEIELFCSKLHCCFEEHNFIVVDLHTYGNIMENENGQLIIVDWGEWLPYSKIMAMAEIEAVKARLNEL